ncbi:ABC transporter ATP-binding protein [Planctomycetota bacterium]|nr:ABC transporter ATP-binding protein [Planctomycetota bacterium]
MAILLSCQNLAKAFDAHPLFEDLSFGIHGGERTGLIGPNGAGKSTLMRILAGLEIPDSGDRAVASGVRMVYLPQRDELPPEPSARQILTAAIAAARPALDEGKRDRDVRMVLDLAGFDKRADQPAGTLSGGWRKRLAILRALVVDADLLLLDEPTNHLDLEGIWWLERTLAASRATVVVISHDRFFLERACTRIIEINRLYPGGCFSSTGGYATFLEKRAEFVANQKKQQEVVDNQARREIEWLRRNPAAQMKKSTARIDAAEKLFATQAGLKWRNAQVRTADVAFAASGRRGNELVTLTGVAAERGGRTLFAGLDLTLSPGERLGVLGLNGSGKTTLLKFIAGTAKPDAGNVRHARELRIAYFDQQRARIDPTLPLRRALCPSGETVIVGDRRLHVAGWAKRFLFSSGQLDLEVGKLSGGEQARVLIADLMRQPADLLILDEPTNDLDIPTLEVLEDALREFTGPVVLVTHDRYLLDRVATTVLALDGGGGAWRVADSTQWEDLAERITAERAKLAAPPEPAPAAEKNPGKGLTRSERREFDGLTAKIEAAEAARAEVEAKLADPAIGADPDALDKACTELAEKQQIVDDLFARWSELDTKAKG